MTQRQIDIILNEDKSLSYTSGRTLKLGNQFDNKISKIKLIIPEIYEDIVYKYCVVRNPYGINILKQLNEDNSFVIEQDITEFSGDYQIMFLFSNVEVKEPTEIDNTQIVLATDLVNCTVIDNYLEIVAQNQLFCIPNTAFNSLDETTKNLLLTYKIM